MEMSPCPAPTEQPGHGGEYRSHMRVLVIECALNRINMVTVGGGGVGGGGMGKGQLWNNQVR